MGGSRGGRGQGVQTPPPGKSQVAIGFLRNTGMDSLEKQLDQTIEKQFGPLGQIASRCRFA